jgi:hypothetical protein
MLIHNFLSDLSKTAVILYMFSFFTFYFFLLLSHSYVAQVLILYSLMTYIELQKINIIMWRLRNKVCSSVNMCHIWLFASIMKAIVM